MSIDLTDLTSDGDTLDLGDGRALRLRIEPDEFAGGWNDQMDPECFGTVEWVRLDDCGRSRRPDHFDGTARKLDTDCPHALWWQPPTAKAIGTIWTPEQWREQAAYVLERVRYGWSSVGLELIETVTDSLGGEHLVVAASAWLGGVDDVTPDYLPDVLGDLIGEVIES